MDRRERRGRDEGGLQLTKLAMNVLRVLDRADSFCQHLTTFLYMDIVSGQLARRYALCMRLVATSCQFAASRSWFTQRITSGLVSSTLSIASLSLPIVFFFLSLYLCVCLSLSLSSRKGNVSRLVVFWRGVTNEYELNVQLLQSKIVC